MNRSVSSEGNKAILRRQHRVLLKKGFFHKLPFWAKFQGSSNLQWLGPKAAPEEQVIDRLFYLELKRLKNLQDTASPWREV